VLDQNGRLSKDPGYQNFIIRYLGPFPLFQFMLVPWIGGLEGISSGTHFQDNVDDVLELHVVDSGTHIDAVAGVEANAVLRHSLEGRVERLNTNVRPFTAFRD